MNPIKNQRILSNPFVQLGVLVIIPGIILCVLAFRGILNDQALKERQKRRELIFNAEQSIQELKIRIEDSAQTFLISSTAEQRPSLSQSLFLNDHHLLTIM